MVECRSSEGAIVPSLAAGISSERKKGLALPATKSAMWALKTLVNTMFLGGHDMALAGIP